jgi:hypothetical protein
LALDRSIRSLLALNGAGTSRVLNLCTIEKMNGTKAEYRDAPLFVAPVLNTAIFIKHRLRPGEAELFSEGKSVATKIIIPFDKADLRSGGRSVFIGQRNFVDALKQACNYKSEIELKRDLDVLDVLYTLPSLDPFLLREKLRGDGFKVDDCYFSLSTTDQEKMFDYSAREVGRLVAMATGSKDQSLNAASRTMISALLSSESDDRLTPLKSALNLTDDNFREGIFCWRGFLYYKWHVVSYTQQAEPFFRSMLHCRARGTLSDEEKKFFPAAKREVIVAMRKYLKSIQETIAIYDEAYANMIDRRDPTAFREFLLSAPDLFLKMGEKTGAISHIISFWHYCFAPPRDDSVLDAEDLKMTLQDFCQGLGVRVQTALA